MPKWKTKTDAVVAGERSGPHSFRSTTTPIYASSTFYYDDPLELERSFADPLTGYSYGRYGNPTLTAIEEAIASLEGTESALAVSSGMAAVHLALLATGLSAGDTLLLSRDVYGATYALAAHLLPRLGIRTVFLDFTDHAAIAEALIHHRPRAVLFETLSNPLLRVVDAPWVIDQAHHHHAQVVVDATFSTPLQYRPAQDGADFVVHSATKYLSGHGDVIHGLVATSLSHRKDLVELNKMLGSVAGPFDAFLALRGLKTLPLRFAQQSASAGQLAAWLACVEGVQKVFYPGLAHHPQHQLATKLFGGQYGAMLSFELSGGERAVYCLLRELKLILPATTLGDVYSLVLYPKMSSHRALTPQQRAAVGIQDGLVRLSVGIEDAEDLKADLQQAIGKGLDA